MEGLFRRALVNGQKVKMMYIDNNDQITFRIVKLLKMNEEHLFVYCYYRKKVRTLKMDNILSAEAMSGRLERKII